MPPTPRPLGGPKIHHAIERPLALPAPADFGPVADQLPGEPASTSARSGRKSGLSLGLAWRAVRRHAWVALIAWAAGTAGLIAWADRKIRPGYQAVSVIKVDAGDRGRFRDGGPGGDFEVYKQTQARRLANPGVIEAAIKAHPELLGLPTLARGQAPEDAVRSAIVAQVVPQTDLIQVTMTSPTPDEPARVVDAVIESFLRATENGDDGAVEKVRRIREARDARAREVDLRRSEVVDRAAKLGAIDSARARDRDAVALDQYKTLSNQLLTIDLEMMAARAKLDRARQRSAAHEPDAKVDAAVVAAFYADPQVATLRGQVEAARDELAQADRVARNASEIPRGAARKTIDEGQKQIDQLWIRKKPALAQAAKSTSAAEVEAQQAAGRLVELEAMTAGLNDRLGRLNAQTKAAGADELTLEFARHDLARSEAMLDTLTKDLDRAEVEAKGAVAGFRQEFPARVAELPDGHRRIKAMVIAPFGMLLGVVGLLVLAELRSGRVVGPDDLPTTLQPRVLGVLPTLPRPGTARHRDDIARFVQGLEHLRVVLCDRRDHRSRRCLLITSASVGEGKTTLAAQLAERCVNAGLSTLLIDADLRSPTLSQMFDQGNRRGLADVLRGEATAEEAIGVIGDAGGVHFLAAGTDRADPGRLLHGEALGRLLARARESFDMVIVDAPPVLPVPDALTIGRWVDGAVLSVRSDTSRFPLIEQADQRLASMGVPVLGAVVAGVRDAGRAYGVPTGPGPVVTSVDG
ncbi:polysaccharide biosynthesis tyrosine autokinase (plasmid) [Tundrisphaera sp. TA3]|uniref:polysaccharide biosynthesis tyrosine autokinase n=1 Tax=Tundrisphaera sp. TA3 TaxID=3435775 RepID=UPI003EB75C72